MIKYILQLYVLNVAIKSNWKKVVQFNIGFRLFVWDQRCEATSVDSDPSSVLLEVNLLISTSSGQSV